MPDIWWINQYAVTPDLPGGTRHYDLGVELGRQGFRVRVFASDINLALRQRTKLRETELYHIERRDGVEFVWVRSVQYKTNNWRRTANMLSFSLNVMRIARQLARTAPPSIVIGSSPHPFAALAAARIAASSRVPFCLELRDLWPQALVDTGGASEHQPAIIAMRILERYLYRNAHSFILLARGSQGYLERRGVAPDRCLYLPNGVHLGHFRSALTRDEARRKYGFTGFTVVYTGAHGQANSLETAVHAAKLLENTPIQFVLVGDGPEKAAIRSLAQQKRVENIRFMDPVPKSEIPDLLAAADAGLITLKNAEAFRYGISPNKLFDYMAARLPILCSVPGDMAETVKEAGAGLVCTPGDPAELATIAHNLATLDGEALNRLGQNGFTYLAQHFQREMLAEQMAKWLGAAATECSQSREPSELGGVNQR